MLQNVLRRFQQIVTCSVSIPSHHVFPLAANAKMFDGMIEGIFFCLTSLFLASLAGLVFCRVSDGSFG